MTRNDLRLVIDPGEHVIDGGDHALHGTSAVAIDKWVHAVEEIVAHVHDIRFLEVHDGVAVGVRRRYMLCTNRVSVEVERDGPAEGHDRQRLAR